VQLGTDKPGFRCGEVVFPTGILEGGFPGKKLLGNVPTGGLQMKETGRENWIYEVNGTRDFRSRAIEAGSFG
jgi:hypothetical protein